MLSLIRNRAGRVWKRRWKVLGTAKELRGLLASAFGFRDHDWGRLQLYALREANSNPSAPTRTLEMKRIKTDWLANVCWT